MKTKRSTIKKRLWSLVSKYIRTKASDDFGYVTCVTCGVKRFWNDGIDAGHFIPKSRGDAIYFVEENIHCQCKRCNLMEGGNFEHYYPFMIATYGKEKVEELIVLSRTTVKLDLLALEEDYKMLYEAL